jgi:signal transduction histidine kinase
VAAVNPAASTASLTDAPFWRRVIAALNARSVGWAVALALLVAAAIAPIFVPPLPVLIGRTLFISIVLLLAYTAAGQWRQRVVPRWVAQVLLVAFTAPLATVFVYALSTGGDFQELFGNPARVTGLLMIGGSALALGVVIGLGALYRERDAQANAQALAFALERETLQRQAADARLALLEQQVEPHFLFNTLANVQALVESGSPRAVPLFRSLIDYLRAAVPHLKQHETTLGDEERLVRAYLALMQMRMPDRLALRFDIDETLRGRRFPPLALLTLVENAIRHGIDAAEDPGSIEVGARADASGEVRIWVADTGVGMSEAAGEGSGLANLKARLKAFFGPEARLELSEQAPHGVRAEMRLPAAAGA